MNNSNLKRIEKANFFLTKRTGKNSDHKRVKRIQHLSPEDLEFFTSRMTASVLDTEDDTRGAKGFGMPASRFCENFCDPELWGEELTPEGNFYGDTPQEEYLIVVTQAEDFSAVPTNAFSIIDTKKIPIARIFEERSKEPVIINPERLKESLTTPIGKRNEKPMLMITDETLLRLQKISELKKPAQSSAQTSTAIAPLPGKKEASDRNEFKSANCGKRCKRRMMRNKKSYELKELKRKKERKKEKNEKKCAAVAKRISQKLQFNRLAYTHAAA